MHISPIRYCGSFFCTLTTKLSSMVISTKFMEQTRFFMSESSITGSYPPFISGSWHLMTLPSLCLTFRHHLQCVGTNPHKVFLRNPPQATGDQKVTGLAAWPWGHWKLWSNIYLHLWGIYIYIYIWLLSWANKTSSENKGTSTDLFRILRIQNLGFCPELLGCMLNIYSNYTPISIIWAPTFISYMSEREIQRSPSTLLLRVLLYSKKKMDLSPAIPMDYGYHHGFENTNHRHHKPKA